MEDDSWLSYFDEIEWPKVTWTPRVTFELLIQKMRNSGLVSNSGGSFLNNKYPFALHIKTVFRILKRLRAGNGFPRRVFIDYNQNFQEQFKLIWNNYQIAVRQNREEEINYAQFSVDENYQAYYSNKWARAFQYVIADALYQGSPRVLCKRHHMRYIYGSIDSEECESAWRKMHELCKYGPLLSESLSYEQLQQEADSILS